LWAAVADNEILPPESAGAIIDAFVRKGAIWLVGSHADNSVTVWDYTHNVLVASLKGHTAHDENPTVDRARLDIEGRRLISAIGDHTARVWDIETGTELSHVAVAPGSSMIYDIGFSRDGKLAYATADALYIWEVESGKIVSVIRPQGNETSAQTYCASFNPPASQIVTATDGETRIWDVATGKALRTLADQWLECARYSPDGQRIAVVPTHGETVEILDSNTGSAVASLIGHTHFINDLDYSFDGRFILTTSEDSTARVWNAQSGRQPRIMTDVGGMFRARFSDDSRKVLTQSGGPAFMKISGAGTEPWRGRLWPVFADTAAMLVDSKIAVPRCLTRDQRIASFIDPDPPAWCIEAGKWPYDSPAWQAWLKYTRVHLHPPRPDTPEWKTWLGPRK
jgi:WD40 repeat protein